jgi:hypothetical protein
MRSTQYSVQEMRTSVIQQRNRTSSHIQRHLIITYSDSLPICPYERLLILRCTSRCFIRSLFTCAASVLRRDCVDECVLFFVRLEISERMRSGVFSMSLRLLCEDCVLYPPLSERHDPLLSALLSVVDDMFDLSVNLIIADSRQTFLSKLIYVIWV